MGLEGGIWASILGVGPGGWWERGYVEGEGGENSQYVWKHRSLTPLGPLTKRADLRPNRANYWPERADLGLERADLGP